MTDQNSQFFAILTAIGEAKQANANALGVAWTFSHMGVGDANLTNPTPDRAQTKLINERRRAPLNQLSVDPSNASLVIAEQVIPPDAGGWWIREIGLYDSDGDLVAVANCAPSFKPLLTQGSGKTQIVRLNLVVTSTANVELKIDPSVVLATRQYVDQRIIEVLPATRIAGSYTKVTTDTRGVVVSGSNPTTVAGYGITDAYTRAQTDSLLSAKAGKATTLAGYGIADAHTQAQITALLAAKLNVASPAITGIGTCSTPPLGTNTKQIVNAEFVQSTLNALIAGAPGAMDTLSELAAALGNDPNFAATITQLLAAKAPLVSPAFSGIPIADTATLGTRNSQLATTLFVDNTLNAVLSAVDPWAMQPIGVPIPVSTGAAEPPTNKAYRYIKLTASDPYNTGALTEEVVKGVAPMVIAYGRVSFSGSPISGNTVYLINTERRYIRPGSNGSIEFDQLQGHSFPSGGFKGVDGVVLDTWNAGAITVGVTATMITDGLNGAPRFGTETRPKSIGADFYMRIK